MLLFLNISGGEIFLVLVFVLMFFGANSIPTMARTLGRGFRQIKDAANQVQDEIRKSASEVEKQVKEPLNNAEGEGSSISKEFKDLKKDIEN
jgi:sec-independent protein translocase protein TatA